MKILSLLAAFVIAAIASVPGHAADKGGVVPPIAPTFDESPSPMTVWSGVYIEGGFGMTFSELELGAVGEGNFLTLGDSGFSGHVGLGYDKMISPNVLVGALARLEFSDISFDIAGENLGDSKLAYLIGARLGWVPREDAMLYGLLGYKWTEFDLAAGLGNLDTGGVVVGGGLELMLTDHVGLGAEYTTTLLDSESVDGAKLEPTEHAAKLRLLYKF